MRRGTVIGIFSVTNSVTRQTFDSGGIWFIEIECLKQYLLADYTVTEAYISIKIGNYSVMNSENL